MLGDIAVQDTPTIVADDEEAIKHAEGDRRNTEEVHRGNRFPVIAEKGKPAHGRLRISRCPFHPTRDRSLRGIKTEHERLAMVAWRSRVGFSTTIRKTNSWTSFDVGRVPTGILTLEISFQHKRNPALCQRTTVSGVTTMRDCCHPDQNRRTATQKSLSTRSSLGRGCRRFRTASC